MNCQQIVANVIPPNQGFDDNDYSGMFYFRFWVYGDWYDVVIDDKLPCSRYYDKQLVYCSNKNNPNEFWPMLVVRI